MRLTVLLPVRRLIDTDCLKLVIDTPAGSLCLLPHHLDLVTALTTGILHYIGVDGLPRHVGTDEGILIKCGRKVCVATRDAFVSDLAGIRDAVRRSYVELDDREKDARSALARLESGIARRFVDLQDRT